MNRLLSDLERCGRGASSDRGGDGDSGVPVKVRDSGVRGENFLSAPSSLEAELAAFLPPCPAMRLSTRLLQRRWGQPGRAPHGGAREARAALPRTGAGRCEGPPGRRLLPTTCRRTFWPPQCRGVATGRRPARPRIHPRLATAQRPEAALSALSARGGFHPADVNAPLVGRLSGLTISPTAPTPTMRMQPSGVRPRRALRLERFTARVR